MNSVLKGLVITGLTLSSTIAMAMTAPRALITHNKTAVESNAWIDGTMPSSHPTPANSDKQVAWTYVRIACIGHTTNNTCKALVKMATNTNSPVELGYLSMNMTTGEITPKEISANGYQLVVNGPAEITLLTH